MPIYNRRLLRQRLGLDFLRDTVVGQTSGSWGTQAGSANIVDSAQADPTASGEQLYYRHWLRLLGSAGFIQDIRVGSFNTGSGAFLSAQTLATTIYSGMPFEVHGLLSPAEKDRALDGVIQGVRIRQEVPIWAVPQNQIYSLGPEVLDVMDVRYFSDPTNSLNRSEHQLSWWKYDNTASGNELRINTSLLLSQQLIVDALLSLTLGAGDLATVNLPDDAWPLWGAAAECYWVVERRTPGQDTGKYQQQRLDATKNYTRLTARFQPSISRKIQLDEPW